MDDWQLLNLYATKRSEEAFRALVERYAGMVYHAALRQTGNPDAAEEAAQVVFIALAQKAGRIPRRATLHGWLFRAIRYAVANQARTNANRQCREQEALAMQPNIESDEPVSVWERITPYLDDALDALSPADREMVMMRFFGNKSHKDIAETLGVTEETARKRLSRAIDRLRVIFEKRGIAVLSLALTAAFAEHGAKAAPVESASAWATAALAKAATGTAMSSAGGILSYVTSLKSPALAAGVAGLMVLGGAAFAIYKSAFHAGPLEASAARNPDASFSASNADTSTATVLAGANRIVSTDALALAALDKVRKALHDPNPTTVYPNAMMETAIAGLGEDKQSALPILEESLQDTNAVVRLRAVDGLGIVGPQAGGAAPRLLKMLRDGGIGEEIQGIAYSNPPSRRLVDGTMITNAMRPLSVYTDNIILYSLGKIHPSNEILPQFARMLKENRPACIITARAVHQFSGSVIRRSMPDGGWLWAVAGENAKALNDAFHPLLQDPDPLVRRTAVFSLVRALGD